MIRYRFDFDKDNVLEFACDPNGDTSRETGEETIVDWLRLDRHRCPHCEVPLQSRWTCPAALSLLPVIRAFSNRISHETVKVTVMRDDLKLEAVTSTQQAVRSLVGLLLALSSCPVMMRLRPMAYFHLPFGDTPHTVFRAVGMFLTAQYMRQLEGLTPEWNLQGLLDAYSKLHQINAKLAARLREAAKKDATVNSVVILDVLSYEVEMSIEKNLMTLKPLFAGYLKK